MIGFTLAAILFTLALGTFAALTFVWQWVVGAAAPPLAQTGIITILVLACAAVYRRLRPEAPRVGTSSKGLYVYLALFFAATVVISAAVVQCLEAHPLGGMDGMAIWNMHARFLYLGGAGWTRVFDPALFWSHNDYPLLLPSLVSSGWTMAGSADVLVPKVLSYGFGVLAVILASAATCAVTRDARGWLAGLILLATPSLVMQWPEQMADIPLSVYVLITVVCLQLGSVWPTARPGLLALAGLSAGLAAWTKNEGLLFVIALFASYSIAHAAAWRFDPAQSVPRKAIAGAVLLVLGLLPILALVLAFKFFLAPPGDIPIDASILPKLADVSRYVQITRRFIVEAVTFGDASRVGAANPAILLALFLVLYKARLRRVTATSLTLLALPVLMLAGNFMVYVITPHPLAWHLDTSIARLVLQLWPSVVFIAATVQFTMTDLKEGIA